MEAGQKMRVVAYDRHVMFVPVRSIKEARGSLKGMDTDVQTGERGARACECRRFFTAGWLISPMMGMRTSSQKVIEDSAQNLLVPAIVIYEVFKRVYQRRGLALAHEAVADMYSGSWWLWMRSLALSAAKISVEHKLAMADSMILATARAHDAVLWTQDADFAGLDGVKFKAK